MSRSRLMIAAGLGLMGAAGLALVVPGMQKSRALEALKTRTLSELIYVQSGTFTNGTYTVRWQRKGGSEVDLPVREAANSQPSTEATVSGFYLQAHETDNADFDLFLDSTGRPAQRKVPETNLGSAGYAANMSFREAQAYCAWLGDLADVDMRLPSENEWEFAARSRGLTPPWATDNGQHISGQNMPDESRDSPNFDPPRATYLPSPMGFFNMADGRYEWTSGVDGEMRIAKGGSNLSSTELETIPSRYTVEPMLKTHPLFAQLPNAERYGVIEAEAIYVINATARCVAEVAEAPATSGFGVAPELDTIAFPEIYKLPY